MVKILRWRTASTRDSCDLLVEHLKTQDSFLFSSCQLCELGLITSPLCALMFDFETHSVSVSINSVSIHKALWTQTWWKVMKSESEFTQLCPTLFDPMDCSPPGSSIHTVFQATILEWVAVFFSRGSSRPRGRTQVSGIVGRLFTLWATRKSQIVNKY